MQIDTFLACRRRAGGSERTNYPLFIADLCDLLGVVKPQPANEGTRDNPYVIERRVIFHHGDSSTRNAFIDRYKRCSFTGKNSRKKSLPQLLGTLVAFGHARMNEGCRYEASR